MQAQSELIVNLQKCLEKLNKAKTLDAASVIGKVLATNNAVVIKDAYKLLLDNYQQASGNDKYKTRLLELIMQLGNHSFDSNESKNTIPTQALFFPNEANLSVMINALLKAKKYIYICIYTITNDEIAAAIYWLHSKGVEVKIITDDETINNQGSDLFELAAFGVDVKVDKDPNSRIHHKFAVIDDSTLVSGSFNWTVQAVKSNYENVVITHEKKLVSDFKTEFHRIWNKVETVPKGNKEVEYKYKKYMKKWENQ
jgi:cardiolipin hydrolase